MALVTVETAEAQEPVLAEVQERERQPQAIRRHE